MTDLDIVRAGFGDTIELHRRVIEERAEVIVRAAEVIRRALAAGRQVLAFGNGGSATDAQHLAEELVGRFLRERRAVPVISLTADSSILTAVGNDYGFEAVFARQVEALGRKGDVAIGITTSGKSANVNRALERARALGLITMALTGRDGGETARLVDLDVNVPSASSARVQEVHRTILHVICELVERDL
jgi:D-sedoheptulose 7-phosphate isomerase